ncbi:MAG: TolC family protein [Bacteroidota bacterium]|jgi:outer membrane protein TolC
MRFFNLIVLLILGSLPQRDIFCQISNNAETIEVRLVDLIDRVIEFHPLVKSANLEINKGSAEVLKARGAFDPTIAFQQNQKNFDNINYYQVQTFSLESPTRSGVKVQLGTENSTGQYLNPMDNTGKVGTQYTGLSIPILKDLIIDKKRADFQKSKTLKTMNYWEREIIINNLLNDLIQHYIEWQIWTESSNRIEQMIFNAETRQNGLRKLFRAGASNTVDTLETYVQLEQYRAKLMEIQWKQLKSKIMINSWLWAEDNTPIELTQNSIPSRWGLEQLDSFCNYSFNYFTNGSSSINAPLPPELRLLENTISLTKIDLNYKTNNLLPQLDLKYQYLQPLNNFNYADFGNLRNNNRFGIQFSSPLVYREARGEYQLAKYKYQQTEWKFQSKQREFFIKIQANFNEISVSRNLYSKWVEIGTELTDLYNLEIRRFEAGDANFFIVNTREMRALDAQLKALEYRKEYFQYCNHFLNYTGWYTVLFSEKITSATK